jgi:hypothetical protein
MNPSNGIAVSPSITPISPAPTVTNANLYFFAWLSFCAAIYLSGSLIQELFGVSVQQIATKAARWYGLTAASLVVLASAVRTFRSANCNTVDATGTEYCKRTKFAISVGVIGFALAAGMTVLVQQSMQLTLVTEAAIATLQLTLWCFGVSYITFGKSPGSTIGNLYFSAWICFILTVFLFAVSFREYVAGRDGASNTNTDEAQDDPDDNT